MTKDEWMAKAIAAGAMLHCCGFLHNPPEAVGVHCDWCKTNCKGRTS
jgi:hypothetical protein